MKVKNIISLIAFSAALIFSVMLVGLPKDNFYSNFVELKNSSETRQKIRTFLYRDINNGRDRDRVLIGVEGIEQSFQLGSNIVLIADTTQEYVDASESLDCSNLPADFQEAWQAYMNAWQKQADYLNELKRLAEAVPDNEAFDQGAGNVSRYLFKIDTDAYRQQDEEINRTWYKVLQVGRKYGAYVPVQ